VDKPSIGIPYVYVRTGGLLVEALDKDGRKADAEKVLKTTQAVARGTGLADLLAMQ
jgi:hypothetical protein